MLLAALCTDWYLVFIVFARGNTMLGVSILPLKLAMQVAGLSHGVLRGYDARSGGSLLLSIALALGHSLFTKIWVRRRRGADCVG